MNAREGKKSEELSSAVALTPTGNLPADASSNRGVMIGRWVEIPIAHRNYQEAFRAAFEAAAAPKKIIRHGVQGKGTEYSVSINDGLILIYSIPTARQAEFDRRIAELFAEYSGRPTVRVGYQWPEHIKPASLIEPAPLPSKHEAILNKIFAASDWYDALTICNGAGFSKVNPSAQPNRWKLDGKVFALRRGKTDVYPAYAFGDDFRPLPAMKDVLCVFKDKKTDLKIAAWFASVNSWLRDQRPLDVIGTNPEAVINAAKAEVAPIDHG